MGTFLIWWLMLLVLGLFFMPLSVFCFRMFRDGGWLFSKVFGIVIPGFTVWVLVCSHIIKFTAGMCLLVTAGCLLINILVFWRRVRRGRQLFQLTLENARLIIGEELLFFLLFAMWSYLAGFHPAAYGTEKFMDYGFMAVMMRSETLPAQDIWYAGETINYYYGGQYFAVFLTKLSNTRIQETYHVMRTLVAAFAFVLPFALIRQVWEDRVRKAEKRVSKAAIPAGLLAGAGVSFAGNMHFVLANYFLRWCRGLLGHAEDYTYWFPNSTRYIGYYPEGSDKTIHEFPSYSFILGDLHAHVVNLMFVLLVIGLTYAYICAPLRKKNRLSDGIRDPYLWLFGLLLGVFHVTNYWDFAIYFVIVMAVVVYRNMRESDFSWKNTLAFCGLQAVLLFGISTAAALPFTLNFKTMVSGIALAKHHTSIRQFMIVWGLPLCVCLIFLLYIIRCSQNGRGKLGRFRSLFVRIKLQDIYIAGLALCAIGLILIPEFIYVRDIYEESYARANTMFKLTYQAFTLFGMCMAYCIIRFLLNRSQWLYRIGVISLICFLGTCTYVITAGSAWFGNDLSLASFEGLDAQKFLEEDFPEDAAAIRWLNVNGNQDDVIVEACGDSYSDYERVSAMTGIPTIAGWYVHEWLWRNDTEALTERQKDVEAIYTLNDAAKVQALLKKYQVTYLYVGALEREKYGELDDTFLQSMGKTVFSAVDTYIVKIQ